MLHPLIDYAAATLTVALATSWVVRTLTARASKLEGGIVGWAPWSWGAVVRIARTYRRVGWGLLPVAVAVTGLLLHVTLAALLLLHLPGFLAPLMGYDRVLPPLHPQVASTLAWAAAVLLAANIVLKYSLSGEVCEELGFTLTPSRAALALLLLGCLLSAALRLVELHMLFGVATMALLLYWGSHDIGGCVARLLRRRPSRSPRW